MPTKKIVARDWWQQELFDLMANEKVRVVLEGEVGEVDGSLSVWDSRLRKYEVACLATGAETVEEAMTQLLEQWEEGKQWEERHGR